MFPKPFHFFTPFVRKGLYLRRTDREMRYFKTSVAKGSVLDAWGAVLVEARDIGGHRPGHASHYPHTSN